MSSFTSSSKVNRRYVCMVLALAFAPSLLLFIYGIYLQPLYGDLTRIGPFSEREFGWQGTQQTFAAPVYVQDEYKRHFDVVVLGDSFSRAWPRQQWQNHLIAKTGWSVVTLDIDTVTIDQILANPTYEASPPKLLIVESVERHFADRIGKAPRCVGPVSRSVTPAIPAHAMHERHPHVLASSNLQRPQQWNDVKLGFVWKYLRNTWSLALGGEPRKDVRKLALRHPGLFSSVNQDEILIFKEDFDKQATWKAMTLQEMSCRLHQLRKKVERNGQTRFVLMVAPNKLTAYHQHLADPTTPYVSMLSSLAENNQAILPRIDLTLMSAIGRGEKDVYLPDDTHWGSTGHRISAETLLAFLYP